MGENSIKVTTTGEKLLLGNDIIQLEDQTKETFNASTPVNLLGFLDSKESIAIDLFIGDSAIEAYEQIEREYHSKAFGRTEIKRHPIVHIINAFNGKQQELNDFAITLERIKPYASKDTLALIDNIADLKIKKIVSINNRNDKRGNYEYLVKAEKDGSIEYEFPKSIKLSIPLIKGMNEELREVEFNFYFQWGIIGDGNVHLSFTLENLELDTLLEEEIKAILLQLFSQRKGSTSIYYGSLQIHKQTDEWKYKKNELQIKN